MTKRMRQATEKIQHAAEAGKIELASQVVTEDLFEYVDAVLVVLGHREALVTDESTLSHFDEMGGRPHCKKDASGQWVEYPGDPIIEKRNQEMFMRLEHEFGFPVARSDRIVAIARRLKARGQG